MVKMMTEMGELHMKKFLCIIFVLLIVNVAGLAEANEFDAYDDSSLVALLDSVQQEIANRHIEKSANLSQGIYVAGKDIPTGTYNITAVYKGSLWMNISVYAAEDDENSKQDFTIYGYEPYGDGTGKFYVDLPDGDRLKCDGEITLTTSAGIMFK